MFGLDVNLERSWRYDNFDEEVNALQKAFDMAITKGYKRKDLLKSVRPCYMAFVAKPNVEIPKVTAARVLRQE